jgi:hypothetical protein
MTSELTNLKDALALQFPDMEADVTAFIDTYINDIKQKKAAMRNEGKLSFGKYKGMKPAELIKTEAGHSYLTWLFSQSYFTADKFGDLYETLESLGIKKKKDLNADAGRTK